MTKTLWLAGSAAAVALFAVPADAQLTGFGTGCPGFSGVEPSIALSALPVEGNPFDIVVSGPPIPGGFALLILGASDTIWSGIPLPFDLTGNGFPGCFLNVGFDFTIFGANDVDGDVTYPVAGLNPGDQVFLQAFVFDPDPSFSTPGSWTQGYDLQAIPPSGFVGGEVIFTEFMKDPNFVGDSLGEYVELHNTTASAIDIEGWTLSDNDVDSTVLDNGGAGIVVPAGGYAVIGIEDDASINGNVAVLYEYAQNGQFFLSNSADEIVLTDHTGVEIDRIEYDDGVLWAEAPGSSLELDATMLDGDLNDDPANWALSMCTIEGMPVCNPDLGTPNLANDVCLTMPCGGPATGEIIFSEIMQNPSAVFDSDGEWFEVHNTTGSDIDMMGWIIVAGGSPNQETISTSVVVPAGGFALFARKSDPLVNGGLPTPDYDYVDGLNFGNSSQTVQIIDAAANLSFEMTYDGGATFPDPNGASMTLSPSSLNAADATDGANWCEASSSYGDGDLGTPGAANDSCP